MYVLSYSILIMFTKYYPPIDVRIAVVRNHLSSDPKFFAFASPAVVKPGSPGNTTMLMSASPDGTMWTSW